MVAVSKKSKKSKKTSKNAEVQKPEKKPSVVSGQLKKQIENKDNRQRRNKTRPERGVVFIKNIPHGFFEEQMKTYFAQFGEVRRVRLVRSRRTGNSKGYAFIEFQYPEVAEEVAKATNNSIMFQKLVKAASIPPEEQKFNYFKSSVKPIKTSSGKIKFVSAKTKSILRKAKEVNLMGSNELYKRIKSDHAKAAKVMQMVKEKGYVDNLDLTRHFDMMAKSMKIMSDRRSDKSSSTEEAKLEEMGEILGEKVGRRPEDHGRANSNINDYLSDNEEKNKDDEESKIDGGNDKESTVGSILLIKKRKTPSEEEPKEYKKKRKPSQSDTGLEVLLKADLDDDDSSDDDFIPTVEDNEDSEDDSSKNTDDDEIGNDSTTQQEIEQSSQSDEETEGNQRNYVQILKPHQGDNFEKILKRNPRSGAVQKVSKKCSKNKKEKIKLAVPSKVGKEFIMKNMKKIHRKQSKGSGQKA